MKVKLLETKIIYFVMKVALFGRILHFLGESYTISPPPSFPLLSRVSSVHIFSSPSPPPPMLMTKRKHFSAPRCSLEMEGAHDLWRPSRKGNTCGGDGESTAMPEKRAGKESGRSTSARLLLQHYRALLHLYHMYRYPQVGVVGHMPLPSPVSFSVLRSTSSLSTAMVVGATDSQKWVNLVGDDGSAMVKVEGEKETSTEEAQRSREGGGREEEIV